KEWDESIAKLKKKLSKWKLKTLSVGGCLTLFKAVLGSTPIYNMSLFMVPKQVIYALHGSNPMAFSTSYSLIWSIIIKEVNFLKAQGVDLLSHCKVRLGNGLRISFLNDPWIGDTLLKHLLPRLYALEVSKQVSVAKKFTIYVTCSFRRVV
nr:hypothetical protein [Tanacetum cinerariifolium]